MAKSGEGESEVLLGNRQLLSLFVVVVILLAVFFTMGYVLGKHSGNEAVATGNGGSTPPAAPPSGFTEPNRRPPVSSGSASVPDPVTPDNALSVPTAKLPPATSTPAPHVAPPLTPTEPAAGLTFLQVRALKRTEAEIIAEVLKKKGFPTALAPGPSEGIVRVLVGPLRDAAAINSTRNELEKAGFNPFLRRY